VSRIDVRLGIDASNLRAGGGVTHLAELLRVAQPQADGFEQVIVWGCRTTLARLEPRAWLRLEPQPLLERALPCRLYWRRRWLGRLARAAGCHALFAPGGSLGADFGPAVTMSRNMLPFEWRELRRFGLRPQTVKMLLLRRSQSRSFRRAAGVIFLTDYARVAVQRLTGPLQAEVAVIPHGVGERFRLAPRTQLDVHSYSKQRPMRLLYVSIVDVYKHQWRVAEAVAQLQREGLPVQLDLIGPAYPPALRRLRATLARVDPRGEAVRYLGAVSHAELHGAYAGADIAIFASSCENMPNILLEMMASGLPIACSSRGPMPEILSDAGLYFDPEDAAEIATTLRALIVSPELRERCARRAFTLAGAYSWGECADATFRFLARVARGATLPATSASVGLSQGV
jgi:glycosyltransferase involved in cell wall biosynthesis